MNQSSTGDHKHISGIGFRILRAASERRANNHIIYAIAVNVGHRQRLSKAHTWPGAKQNDISGRPNLISHIPSQTIEEIPTAEDHIYCPGIWPLVLWTIRPHRSDEQIADPVLIHIADAERPAELVGLCSAEENHVGWSTELPGDVSNRFTT